MQTQQRCARNERTARNYARNERPREAGYDGQTVTILLLGLTGCAGVQQRMGWTEPPYLGDEEAGERPLSRLAFRSKFRRSSS